MKIHERREALSVGAEVELAVRISPEITKRTTVKVVEVMRGAIRAKEPGKRGPARKIRFNEIDFHASGLVNPELPPPSTSKKSGPLTAPLLAGPIIAMGDKVLSAVAISETRTVHLAAVPDLPPETEYEQIIGGEHDDAEEAFAACLDMMGEVHDSVKRKIAQLETERSSLSTRRSRIDAEITEVELAISNARKRSEKIARTINGLR